MKKSKDIQMGSGTWKFVKKLPTDINCSVYSSTKWLCANDKPAKMFIYGDFDGFSLECFSAGDIIPTSYIRIYAHDFAPLFIAASGLRPVFDLATFAYEEKCALVANYLCCKFCSESNITHDGFY